MSTFPGSPHVLKGGIVLLDSTSGAVQRIITLQYNPDTLTRSLQVQAVDQASKNRSQALRLIGTPVETFKLDAEIDATDQLEFPDQNQAAVQVGVYPQLAALETIIYPPSSQLLNNNSLAQSGVLEIAPMEAPLTLFVWSKNRVVPVRVTDFSVTEEAFDATLNPIRAKVSLGMRVLSIDDLGFDEKGGNLFMVYQQQKERLAGLARAGRSMIWGLEEFHERCQSDSIDFHTVAVCGCVAEPVRTEQPVSGNSYVDLDYGGWTHRGVFAAALCAAPGAAGASAAAHGDAGGAAGCDRGAISGR